MRINDRLVVQMVGDDSFVFVDDRTGVEAPFLIEDADDVLQVLEEQVADEGFITIPSIRRKTRGQTITVSAELLPRIRHAIDYFVSCSKVPVEEQMKQVTVHSVDSIDDVLRLLNEEES